MSYHPEVIMTAFCGNNYEASFYYVPFTVEKHVYPISANLVDSQGPITDLTDIPQLEPRLFVFFMHSIPKMNSLKKPPLTNNKLFILKEQK